MGRAVLTGVPLPQSPLLPRAEHGQPVLSETGLRVRGAARLTFGSFLFHGWIIHARYNPCNGIAWGFNRGYDSGMNVNKVFYGGRLSKDPELRFTPSNTAVCNFSVATNRRVKNKETGVWEDAPPTFIDITAWGKTAENVAKFFSKGDEILVLGRLDVDEWDDRQSGQRRTKVKIVADEFQFCGPKRDKQSSPQGSQGYGNNRQPGEDDIEF